MSIPLRHASPGKIVAEHRTFFISSSIADKRNLLQSDRSAKLFIDVLYRYRAEHKFLLHGFVVMPDHFHVLITIGPEISIERAIQFIKGGFAFRAGRELSFRSPVWQRGFSEVRIYDAEAYVRVQEYIAENPVKRGLVQKPEEFPYSSACLAFELDDPPQGLKPVSVSHLVRHA
jgi:putative transposase